MTKKTRLETKFQARRPGREEVDLKIKKIKRMSPLMETITESHN